MCIFLDLNIAAPNDNEDQEPLDLNMLPADINEESEQASITSYFHDNTWNSGSFFLELQEANNFSKADFKEIMTISFEAKTWVVATPALGVEIHQLLLGRYTSLLLNCCAI